MGETKATRNLFRTLFRSAALARTGAPPALAPGAELVPGFRLVERLGRGGSGEVWKATGPGGFPIALKFSLLSAPTGPTEQRSLTIIKHIRHPHLLSVFGSWEADGYLILGMELADRTLFDRFHEAVGQGEVGIPAPEVIDAFDDAAKGIDYLNEARHPSPEGGEPVGIQHRDIKPQNLLLVGGSVKVADFGLARILRSHCTSHTGSMTPSYAAPEFFQNQTSRNSDQYSLGVSYCHLRGGRLPFTGTIEQIITGHLMQPPDLSMVPPGERDVVARALSKAPAERWPSCRAFVDGLRARAPGGSGRLAAPAALLSPTPPPPLPLPATALLDQPSGSRTPFNPAPPRRRRTGLLWGGAVTAAVASGLVVAALARRDPGGPSRADAGAAARRDQAGPAGAAEVRRFPWDDGPVACLAFAPDGRHALLGDELGTVVVWEPETGRERFRLGGHTGGVAALGVAPDGRLALVGCGRNPFLAGEAPLRLWDLETGVERPRFEGHAADVSALAVSPDGRAALAADEGGSLRLWDLGPGRGSQPLAAPGVTTCLAVAPDGRHALSGGSAGALVLWDLGRGAVVHRFDGHRAGVFAVAFSADGAVAASAAGSPPFRADDPSLKTWNVASAAPLTEVDLPEETSCLAFTPDGRQALIGGEDGSLRLWDVADGNERLRFRGHAGRVACAAVAPDGRLALSAGGDGTVLLWRLKP